MAISLFLSLIPDFLNRYGIFSTNSGKKLNIHLHCVFGVCIIFLYIYAYLGGGNVYQIGDKVVHPMHGAGVIESIVRRKVNGEQKDYYLLNLSGGTMTVMIPTDNTREIGVRPIISDREAADILRAMEAIEVDMTQNWNRRYRENMVRLKSGDLLEVARVVKGLMLRESERGLSTGERKMLHTAKQILISELVLAQSLPYDAVEKHINEALA